MRFFIFFIILFLTSCSNTALQSELDTAKSALAKSESALTAANQQIAKLQKEEKGKLVHTVYLKVKPGIDISKLITEIKELQSIPTVKALKVGTFENMGDKRALAEYDVVMEMNFTDKAAYESYQQHPTHLALKNNLVAILAGPPATYDFIAQ